MNSRLKRIPAAIALIVVTIASVTLYDFYHNGTFEEDFPSPEGKAHLRAYRLLRFKNYMAVMPGDGGWHQYVFRLEIGGIGEVRRSEPTYTNIRVTPPMWNDSTVSLPGETGPESWDTKQYRRSGE